MAERSIIHLDLDTFFVSCERLMDSRLQGRPVLVGGTGDRGVVAACSYEARRFGVHSAMPMKLARRLCPEAVVLRGDSGTYSRFSKMVTDIIREEAPLFEKSSIDEFYIDASGMDRFFGCFRWACALRDRIIKESALPISLGMSTSKTVAKVGTGEAKPNNFIEVPCGRERRFLAPLSVRKIPMVGEQRYRMLRSMGVVYIKTLQEMPAELMERVMGAHGVLLWKKARGVDNSPVIPYHERKSISLERTFNRDTTDVRKLKDILTAMAENLTFQLRSGDKLTGCVAVKIRYADFQTHTRQCRLPYTAADHMLIPRVLELFNQLYRRRVRIRLVGVRYSHLVGGGHQISLFDDSEEIINLYQAMDHIRRRYGQDAIKRAVALDSRHLGHANPFNGQPPVIPAHRSL